MKISLESLFNTPEPSVETDRTIINRWSKNGVLSDSNNVELVQHRICYLYSDKANKKPSVFKVYYKEKTVNTSGPSPRLFFKQKNEKDVTDT